MQVQPVLRTDFVLQNPGDMATMVKGVDTTAYTYDKENRLTQVKKNGNLVAEFSYDGDGGRTKKTTYSTSTPGLITSITTYVGSLQEKTSLATVDHIYQGSQLVASINNGVITYAHQDHLGGTNVITNAAGVKTEVTEYKPFGEIKRRDRYGSSQEVAWYYFTGKKLDDETGLYYYGNPLQQNLRPKHERTVKIVVVFSYPVFLAQGYLSKIRQKQSTFNS